MEFLAVIIGIGIGLALYRKNREKIRNMKSTILDYKDKSQQPR